MQITLFSFLSAVAWHSILVVIIYFMRRIDRFNLNCGIAVMIALYLGGIIRIAIPLEFANTVVIPSARVYPVVYRILHNKCFIGTFFEGQVVSYLMIVWLAVSGILLIRYIVNYVAVSRNVIKFTKQCDKRVAETMEHVKAQASKRFTVDVLICSDTYIPFGMGVFKRKILLPNREYNERDLYFVLLHEYTHFVNRDISVKILISVFCIVFWWNPLVYLLKKDLEQTLELKCDLTIVKWFSPGEKADYLQAILNALKDIAKQKRTPAMSTALLQTGREIEIKERFNKIMNYRADEKRGFINTGLLLMFVLLVTISYIFILQPAFEAPNDLNDINAIGFGSVDSYLIKTEDGQYELFIQNESKGIITKESADMFIEDGFPVME